LKKISPIFFLFAFLVCCTKPKDTNISSQVFETNNYKAMDDDKKLLFLDSLSTFSNTLKNDSLTRKFLFDLSNEYYYLNKNTKSLAGYANLAIT
jgi:hypothetical protein